MIKNGSYCLTYIYININRGILGSVKSFAVVSIWIDNVEIKEDKPNKNKQRVFIQSLLYMVGESATIICIWADSKAVGRVGKLHNGK